MKYQDFLQEKTITHKSSGFNIELSDLNSNLFDWQKVIVRWALYKGKAALFEGCGLGKTIQQLEWANQVHKHTKGNILILAPLAVSAQTIQEGKKFGIEVHKCRTQDDVRTGINITNYEMLDRFDADSFPGIVLDEAGILKSFMGKIKRQIVNVFRNTPYKLECTATPSPNDLMELLNHADFLDIMPSNEALSRWFINDTMHFGTYRLKGYAINNFWSWVSTWAVVANSPSDIGYEDDGFVLPPLQTYKHIIKYQDLYDFKNGELFRGTEILNASNLYRELRETTPERTDFAADIVNQSKDMWVVWCHTNYEADALKKKIPDAIEIRGSMTISQKESLLEMFINSQKRVLIGKPSMLGFGLNLQHVSNMVFVGLSYSFEQRYQAIRRLWRFGQKKPVDDHIVLSPAEVQVFSKVQIKAKQHEEMQRVIINNIKNYSDLNNSRLHLESKIETKEYTNENYTLVLGDAVQEIKKVADESIHFTIFSPPFSSLYIYSDHLQDMGNSKNDDEFFKHFGYLIPELKRITIPGRLCAIHCKDLVDYKSRDGKAGLRDFPGEIVRLFQLHGWKYHSRVTIWKDPVIEMQRTKSQGLLHKQIKKDASMSRQGLPDYLILFRKWPENSETSGPQPVENPVGFESYIGNNVPESTPSIENDLYSIHVWQRYASPVWFDISQTNVLNHRIARTDKDEKHICPLQLDVIERSIHLWTNPGDMVFTPFAGIGSEIYSAIKMGRKGYGIELKKEYIDLAIKNIKLLEIKQQQKSLFEEL